MEKSTATCATDVSTDEYDEAYFERGVETGKSWYQNYRWIPELTIPMAMTMIEFLDIKREDTVLDYGCAKGFLVKALRLLHRQAWGVDISQYALSNLDSTVNQYCFHVYLLEQKMREFQIQGFFDFCIAKDVFEHIPLTQIKEILFQIKAKRMFAVIPLGDGLRYRASINDLDKTHKLCHGEDWWESMFERSGWVVEDCRSKISGIKDSYEEDSAFGFFTLKKDIFEVS